MKNKIHLTKKEREIMDVLWEQEKALTASEIIKAKEDSSLYNTSVQVYLKVLLKKNIIEVVNLKKTTRCYARTFKARIFQYDYFFQEDFHNMPLEKRMKFIKAVLQDVSLEELHEIEKIFSVLKAKNYTENL